MFKSYTFSAPAPGRRVLILGAVHGNEIAGTLAQERIIRQIKQGELRLKSGSVTFIPTVNEAARQRDVRFIDANLNRIVRYHPQPYSNEEKIANSLIRMLDSCDIMLDLHSTHCEGDVEFAFIDHPTAANLELLSLIPVKTALAGWPQIYAGNPDISNFSTEEYAYTHGKTGITVECGYHKSPQAIEVACRSILNVLACYGIIDAARPAPKQPSLISLDSFIVKRSPGRLSRPYKHLDAVKRGEILAVCNNGEQIAAPFDGYIIMPAPQAAVGSEWFYLGHKKKKG